MRLNPTPGALRRDALERLAVLSAKHPSPTSTSSAPDIPRLCSLYQRPTPNGYVSEYSASASKVPMSCREFEVLLALCRAAPSIALVEHAERLLKQLIPYLADAHTQTFRPSPFLKDFQPSPWELLLREVTSAILALGLHHPSLRPLAADAIYSTVDVLCKQGSKIAEAGNGMDGVSENDWAAETTTYLVSLLGFLDALSSIPAAFTIAEHSSIIFNLQGILNETFSVTAEGTLSSIRNAHGNFRTAKEWRRLLKIYASAGRPLGAIILQQAFMHYVAAATASMLAPSASAQSPEILDYLLATSVKVPAASIDGPTLGRLAGIIGDSIALLDADADYLQLSSAWQQRLAFSAKADSLISFLCCSLINEDIADADVLVAWIDAIQADPVSLADETLASAALKCMTVLAHTSPTFSSSFARSLPRLIVQGKMTAVTSAVAAECLADVLQLVPQDLAISTLYSLGNVLSSSPNNKTSLSLFLNGSASANAPPSSYKQHEGPSTLSLVSNDAEETEMIHGGVVGAVIAIARKCNDEKITALAVSMLVQKIGRANAAVDAKIIVGSAALALQGGPNELRPLLRFYSKVEADALSQDNTSILKAVMDARLMLAREIGGESPLYEVYLLNLLDGLVSTNDAIGKGPQVQSAEDLAVAHISQRLPPLAALASSHRESTQSFENLDSIRALSRDAWFNLVAHGFALNSPSEKLFHKELQVLALFTPSLIDLDRADTQESGIDLNTVLRRGMSHQHAAQMKTQLIAALPSYEGDIKGLDYAELTFLNAAHLAAILRAQAGDCTRTMEYFLDPKFKQGALANCLFGVAITAVDTYLTFTSTGRNQAFAAPELAQQLARFFEGCCHRIDRVQRVAIASADRIINTLPSALCQRTSVFAMLELLSLMWLSCLEAETDEYEWKSSYSSTKGNVSINLSDDFAFRQATLKKFQQLCQKWVSKVLDLAPLDMKGLLQTYLSDYDDEGAYGHVSLGRSFAVEMGSLIPQTDQRLGAIGSRRDLNINTASDFMALYTTRQEYRYIDMMATPDMRSLQSSESNHALLRQETIEVQTREIAALLKDIETKIRKHEHVSHEDMRSGLRRAAAVLFKTESDRSGLIPLLVGVPFAAFTKQSIKLGISLWMGVIKENTKLESIILAEIAANWEMTARRKRGIFSQTYQYKDPFCIKEEYAPTDRDAIVRRQQAVHDLIAPHFRLVQFLSSHFSAMRLSSPHVERMFYRLVRVTLYRMRHGISHPLAREVHFHVVLLALRIVAYNTGSGEKARWELKDQILSAGLAWFSYAQRWSFGSNKIQLKAEVQLMSDVVAALQSIAFIGSRPSAPFQTLQPRQDLLLYLLNSEISRLNVWLSPVEAQGQAKAVLNEATLSPLLKAAWTESASLAVQIALRSASPRLQGEVRSQLLKSPEKALDEPDAIHVLLGSQLPSDVSFQLKYMLYWAPVNPISAATYFLPAYGNHPFIIQYAMRALESHSVDVTFFYVPQIVQTLRYDVLGYVERYIIETAKFSQLFAHQIIWNMKANAYKDEESEIPDPVKPTLDKVMDALITSFSAEDKDFYEREFGFFNEVTDISGKLRPFIKRPKPEKKQKIEEELRKIHVDVGVYLPSNPDGVVIGIDRKSGKPLQSHAKAPFMATFRIRKENDLDIQDVEDEVKEHEETGVVAGKNTYEVWQSAIFKVGDDCRQDVLSLQMISAFRGIFNSVGLDVYVFPYRVTATAPGCGVIDVLPNSISRDMLGREAVNGLYEYFVSKYGTEDSLRFQAARNNFVKSMAAYSVISYLLQFKDRHNGNIMIDDAGHILHIDFGFIFDIAPGGVRFERAPFKLTSEMVAVMGGSTQSQPYRWFEELCIKAFLASRQHVEKLSHLIVVMLDSGLPCFKPETVQHFKERFVLDRSEREAAEFMRMLVHRSERSYSTKGYDQFQLLTNGIPY